MNLRVLAVSVLVVSACATESPSTNNGSTSPTPAGSTTSQTQIQCHVDADCALIREEQSGTTGCCFKCGEYTAGSVAQASAAADMCKKKGPCERPISCAEPAEPAYVAKCNGGACVPVKR